MGWQRWIFFGGFPMRWKRCSWPWNMFFCVLLWKVDKAHNVWTYPHRDRHTGIMPVYYRVPQAILQDVVHNPVSIWLRRSLWPTSSKAHQSNALGGCERSWLTTEAGTQPVHTGSEKRQRPLRLPTREGLDILHVVKGVWNPALPPPHHHYSSTAVLPQPPHYLQSQWFDRNEFPSFGTKMKLGMVCPVRASFSALLPDPAGHWTISS